MDGSQKVVHIFSSQDGINELKVEKGRMPEKADECVADADFLASSGYQIGDKITFLKDEDTEVTEELTQSTFQIVGSVSSPEYISFSRGSSMIGNGSVSGFISVLPESFQMDAYTEISIQVKGAKEETAFTKEYDNLVDETKKQVEAIQSEREDIRREELMQQMDQKQAELLNSYFEEQEKGQSQSGEEYDEYQFAKRQLSETGEAYDEVLTGGYYEVGVHIPEGIYTVEAQDGESAIYLIDDENGIYIWQQIGNDPENPNQAAVMDDLRLYDGALLEVESGAALQFRSDCAQTERLHGETNPLQDSVRVEVGQTMTAGRDFPEGLYNVKSEPDWNDLMMTLPDSFLSEFAADEERRVEVISFAPKELDLSYENVPIPKGTEIQTTGAAVTLEPSEKIGSTDYGEFYKE